MLVKTGGLIKNSGMCEMSQQTSSGIWWLNAVSDVFAAGATAAGATAAGATAVGATMGVASSVVLPSFW